MNTLMQALATRPLALWRQCVFDSLARRPLFAYTPHTCIYVRTLLNHCRQEHHRAAVQRGLRIGTARIRHSTVLWRAREGISSSHWLMRVSVRFRRPVILLLRIAVMARAPLREGFEQESLR